MIFSSEQPQTGMNEGTWFSQGRCIKNEGIFCREEKPGALGAEGYKKRLPLPKAFCVYWELLFLQELLNETCNFRFVNLSSNDDTVLVNKNVLRNISYIVHFANLIVPVFKV